ncbi:DUF4861 domain-containing protein [Steroidobacter agaridevorans]|uniref:DUF4861 domain-containing protein n=1 Tax=Steroidobacter agaridevorans TaxID=2695856 RepID=A0A829Y9C4_9GAMM|nr:DUF4861 family protein [Steroidobacter agaridevorans]GFE79944.1 DUF4861 domain-containing protein [Steroidobacter agaridevorans]
MIERTALALGIAAALSLSAQDALAAKATIVLHNDAKLARPAETIVIPFTEVKKALPDLVFDQVIVRDGKGAIVPSQVTAMKHVHRGPAEYDDLIFQRDFRAGEQRVTVTIESTSKPQPPFPSKVWAGHVPERWDDFAWENDEIAHRAYGPALAQPVAGKDRMTSSGIDLWAKKVPYPVMDRWYRKGHDGLHTDTGEGLDFYEVGRGRGVGGVGVWDGQQLAVSGNWQTNRIYANGPVRAIFELTYEPWDAGGVKVTERKRFIVDAGQQLDEVHSTFDFTGDSLTVAIGLTEHPAAADVQVSSDDRNKVVALWEKYKDHPSHDELGTGIVLAPEAQFAGFARTTPPAKGRRDSLMLVKVGPGETVRYFVGGAWKPAGKIKSAADWNAYLTSKAARIAAPIRAEINGVQVTLGGS